MDKESPEEVIARLYKLLMSDSISSETKAWLIAAVTKLTPQAHSSPIVEKLIQEFTVSLNTCLRQHAFELKHLHENIELTKSLLQGAQNCEDIVVRILCSVLSKLCCPNRVNVWYIRKYGFCIMYNEVCSLSHIGRERIGKVPFSTGSK